MRTESKFTKKVHLTNLDGEKKPPCGTLTYNFLKTENFTEVTCLKCKEIINSMYRAEARKFEDGIRSFANEKAAEFIRQVDANIVKGMLNE